MLVGVRGPKVGWGGGGRGGGATIHLCNTSIVVNNFCSTSIATIPLECLQNNNTRMKKNKTSSRGWGGGVGVAFYDKPICQNITTMTNDNEWHTNCCSSCVNFHHKTQG